MFKKTVFVFVLLFFAQAHAEKFGMAGCGIGGLVFKDQPGKIQIVASTLNNLISPQTSALTSGTSGCYETGGNVVNLRYIDSNQIALKEDAARGQGETLDGLITLMGCQDSETVKTQLKTNYNSIFNSQDSQQILNAIKANKSVQKSCGFIG